MARRRTSPWLTGFMVLAATGLVLFGIHVSRPDPPRPLAPEPTPAPVHTRPLLSESRPWVVEAFGETVAWQDVSLASEVAGRVIWRSPKLEAGGKVAKDEALIRLEPRLYEVARDSALAAVESALAQQQTREVDLRQAIALQNNLDEQLQLAKQEHERNLKLRDDGDAADVVVERARTAWLVAKLASDRQQFAVQAAQAAVEVAKAAVKTAEASRDKALYDLEQVELQAPFAGEVSAPMVEVGSWVLPGTPVCRLVNRERLRVAFQLFNEDLLGLQPAATRLRVRFPALKDLEGRVLQVDADWVGLEPVARSDSRARSLGLAVANPGLQIPIGAFAELQLDRGNLTAVWLRPSEFVLEAERATAFVVDSEAHAQARALILGRPLFDAEHRSWLPVISGVEAGEELAIDNLEMLSDGARVLRMSEGRPSPADTESSKNSEDEEALEAGDGAMATGR